MPAPEGATYDISFWVMYAANLSIMIAHSLLFRYADVVFFFGGGEFMLGWIVGVGMVGSLAMRLAQGVGIDRYGPGKIMFLSGLLYVVSCLGHLTITTADSPTIFILRIGYSCAISGCFGASITFISARAPVSRIAEVVGLLGTSGFLAMVLGTWLGDLLLGGGPMTWPQVRLLFLLTAALGMVSVILGRLATRHEHFQPRSRHLSPWGLLRRYHPGAVLLVAAATGFGLGLPGTFLRPYTESINVTGIALFFTVYCTTAFVARFLTRRLPARLGNRKVMYLGLAALVAGMMFLAIADNWWLLFLPAVFLGVSHALVFPSVIAAGSSAFPARYRGLATTLVLAFFDAGTLVGAPIAGAILSYSARLSLSPFPTMFVAVAAIISISAGIYAFAGRVDKADETAASDESGFPDKAASKQEWRESPQPRI